MAKIKLWIARRRLAQLKRKLYATRGAAETLQYRARINDIVRQFNIR